MQVQSTRSYKIMDLPTTFALLIWMMAIIKNFDVFSRDKDQRREENFQNKFSFDVVF